MATADVYPSQSSISAAAWTGPNATVANLHSVTKKYGKTTALDNFSFRLAPGEVVTLLGPNGAGKTTAVRLLLGLIAPNAGAVSVLGRDPRDADARTRTGAMLQVARVPEVLRVRELIDLFRSYYPQPLPTKEIVRIAKLEGLENRLFGKLSGGQRQRTLFGLAICGNPDLVFLDEPTTGMDIESRRALWDEVRALSAAGKAVLLTTHYLEEADVLATRVVVINRGKTICEGTPADIRRRVSGRRIRCVTQLDHAFLATLPTVSDVRQDREAVIVTAEAAEDVVREMLQRDRTLSGLEILTPALEDAFLALTAGPKGGHHER
ncbi:ABC transporter ATP-binding protein [Occallatibacter riparius]|uniref:ABC transporter ATP-binding protein n=1 Tax=Occallatibacter riparius TaxID=1002689 RepID=A0A9J7BHH9_9BACT|nr:ABC transporter ATP-binding protein [Occallatibacter riparius]UWZ81969.1 ABC transporter ATP-binding protein [Occallatibacter riparius]